MSSTARTHATSSLYVLSQTDLTNDISVGGAEVEACLTSMVLPCPPGALNQH